MKRKVKRKGKKLSKEEVASEKARKRQKREMREEAFQATPTSRAWTKPPVIHQSKKRKGNRSQQRQKAIEE